MSRGRDENELIGLAGDVNDGVWIDDNSASQSIEDFDRFDPVEADEDPFMPMVTDNDGGPGFRPFADASNNFDQSGLDTRSRGEDGADEELGDEFVEKMQVREDAAVGEDGGIVSDLTMLARVGQASKDRLVGEAKFVRINPPSASTALMGGSASFLTGDVNTVEVARWTGESQEEALPVTIALSQVSLEPTVAPLGNGGKPIFPKPVRPYAIVQYATRNAPVSFEVDIGLGTQFTIGATAVNVQLGLGNVDVYAGQPDIRTTLAGQLSFYTVSRTVPVTRTLYFDNAGALEVIFTVPYYAKNVRMVRRTATGAYDMQFLNDAAGYVRYSALVPIGTFVQAQSTILSGDIFYIKVTGAPLDLFSLVFELSL